MLFDIRQFPRHRQLGRGNQAAAPVCGGQDGLYCGWTAGNRPVLLFRQYIRIGGPRWFDQPPRSPRNNEGPSRDPHAGKIGSASCRERVCQYVLIWVVAVTLKKKRNTRNDIYAKDILLFISHYR